MAKLILLFILINWSQSLFAQKNIPLKEQLQKSILAFNKGQTAKAERLVDKLLAQEGSYAPAYVWKGKCLQVFEEYSAAYEAYNTACQLEPTVATHWLALANFKSSLGSLSIQKPTSCGDCGKLFLPLIQDNDHEAASYFKSAIEDYSKAILLEPQLVKAHYQLGLTQANLGNQEAACTAIETAYQLGDSTALEYLKNHCLK